MTKAVRTAIAAAIRGQAVVWLANVAAGCSSAPTHATRFVEAGASTTDDAAASDANSGYSLSWSVSSTTSAMTVGLGTGGPLAPPGGIPGVSVCVYGHSEIPCTTSADDGTFTLTGLPRGANLPITLEKEGYLSVLKPIQMGRTPEATTTPITMQLDSSQVPDAGFAIDRQGKGTLSVNVTAASAKLSISPASGNGPVFMNAPGGFGVTAMFYNLDPGDYTLTADDPKNNCAPANFPFSYEGYPAPPHGVAFPVLAGYVDLVGLVCLPYPTIVPTDQADE
jgi:hypothetical protein